MQFPTIRNIFLKTKRRALARNSDDRWSLSYLRLNPLEKVPSDIEVASAQTPKDVAMLAEEVGLMPAEVDLYGKKKAK